MFIRLYKLYINFQMLNVCFLESVTGTEVCSVNFILIFSVCF